MQKVHNVLMIAGLVLLPALLFAQFNNNTTSPFSRYGLGDLHGIAFGRTTAMGSAVIGSRNSQQINFTNPASYTSTDSLAFLFEFGLHGKFSEYKNDLGSYATNDINFRYFAMSFPITQRISSALGLTPYSDVGYDVRVNQTLDNSLSVSHVYFGDGSLSRAFVGIGIEPIKNISIGANLFYFFGTLTRNASISFPENDWIYRIDRNEAHRLRDFGVNFGLQATMPIDKTQSVTVGAILESKPKFTAFNSELSNKTIYIQVPNERYPRVDSEEITSLDEVKGKIQMPLTAGVGISYVKENKLELNTDYFFQQWSKATFFGEPYHFLTNRSIIAVGGEYIPDKFSIRSYTSRIAYRAGLNFENSYLLINNQQVSDFGISFGVGLPVYRSNSTINVSAELGRRGNTENNMVRENYMKINLSVNLYDFWFVKRRFD